ncbi:hypothetical protein HD554DRAFT_731543 [Boletus coccyginus]|nr:hypothetical protein HD554DRAFT_731543 [Boletus coccyginus]
MFVKLSVTLALCLSFASALSITAPSTVEVGGSAELHLGIEAGDPSYIQLKLIGDNVNMVLETDEPVAETMYASIPSHISEGYYVIDAVDPETGSCRNSDNEYAESNVFYMEA